MVEKYQMLHRPPQRNAPDYGSKIHIVSAPVYYHNYMMGQLFASQVHHALCRDVYGDADPNAMTQDRFLSASRKPTARMSAARSAHSDRTALQLLGSGLIVTTKKIAARVSNEATGCGIGLEYPVAPGVVIGSDSIRWCPGEARHIPCSPRGRQPQERVDRACDAQPVVTTRRSPSLMKTERTDDAAL